MCCSIRTVKMHRIDNLSTWIDGVPRWIDRQVTAFLRGVRSIHGRFLYKKRPWIDWQSAYKCSGLTGQTIYPRKNACAEADRSSSHCMFMHVFGPATGRKHDLSTLTKTSVDRSTAALLPRGLASDRCVFFDVVSTKCGGKKSIYLCRKNVRG